MQQYTRTDFFLAVLFHCDCNDVEMLENIKYDPIEILDQLDNRPIQNVGLNRYLRAAADIGICCIKEAIDNRICELEAIPNERDLDDYEEKELAALRKLNPNADFDVICNFSDSCVYLRTNEDAYLKYIPEALEAFEKNTGLKIYFAHDTQDSLQNNGETTDIEKDMLLAASGHCCEICIKKYECPDALNVSACSAFRYDRL